MKVRKQKKFRKTVRFYKACFAFREPFKVLCDGNFLHFLLTQRLGALQDALPALLGASAKAFVTRCIMAELKQLGESFSGTLLAARRLEIAKCNHEPLKSASDCLEAMIANSNPEHFFIATQDAELRKCFRKIYGVALIFAKKNSLFLEPPSEWQQHFSRLSEAERMHVKEQEFKIMDHVERKKKEAKLAQNLEDSNYETEHAGVSDNASNKVSRGEISKQRRKLNGKERPVFKRKRAKVDLFLVSKQCFFNIPLLPYCLKFAFVSAHDLSFTDAVKYVLFGIGRCISGKHTFELLLSFWSTEMDRDL